MQEIKHKAKRKNWRFLEQKEWWVEGYYAKLGNEKFERHFIIQNCSIMPINTNQTETPFFIEVEVEQDTLCSYTGFNDRGKNKIWGNDYVQYEKHIARVVMEDGQWKLKWLVKNKYFREDIVFWAKERQIKVIGNVYDDKDVIKEYIE